MPSTLSTLVQLGQKFAPLVEEIAEPKTARRFVAITATLVAALSIAAAYHATREAVDAWAAAD